MYFAHVSVSMHALFASNASLVRCSLFAGFRALPPSPKLLFLAAGFSPWKFTATFCGEIVQIRSLFCDTNAGSAQLARSLIVIRGFGALSVSTDGVHVKTTHVLKKVAGSSSANMFMSSSTIPKSTFLELVECLTPLVESDFASRLLRHKGEAETDPPP
jgi:hypothetical protein